MLLIVAEGVLLGGLRSYALLAPGALDHLAAHLRQVARYYSAAGRLLYAVPEVTRGIQG